MKTFVYIVVVIVFASCAEKRANLPSITENILPSQYDELPFNLVVSKKSLPNKIKRIYQIQNNDTLNILEFDDKKNLIFKYYKQYHGEYWQDKFVFMIEANVYAKNKLVKTYYLHSNVGYETLEYRYSGENVDKLTSRKLDNVPGVNINQYSFIKKIKSYEECLNFVHKLNDKDYKFNFEINRHFDGNTVNEFYDDPSSYKLYKLNNKREIEKIEYYAKNKKWRENTKYFEYNSSGKLIKSYSLNFRKDTLRSTEYTYNNDTEIIIKKENQFETSKKEFFRDNLIYYKYQDPKKSYSGTSWTILDKYGVQKQLIEKSDKKDTVYQFKNFYEFYK